MPNQQKNYIKEDMDMVELHNALRHNIPQNWRIGQFIMNFLQWLTIDAEGPNLQGKEEGIADIFHIPDDKLLDYWFGFLEKWK